LRFRFSIFVKLVLFIIPLVCIPIAVVGYLSVQASVERVNRLVRQEQMAQVQATAERIDAVFYNGRMDLETLARSPVLAEFYLARLFRLEAEAGFNRENLEKLFADILARTPYYHRIRFLDRQGRERIHVSREGPVGPSADRSGDVFFLEARGLGPEEVFFSGLVRSEDHGGYVVYAARPFFTGWREYAGVVVIDVDFEKIIEIIRAIQVGEGGYSFLIDQEGRTLVHPRYDPYAFGIGDYPDASLRDMVRSMLSGGSGWQTYTFQEEEKVAGFAPVRSMGWSLAVTVPIREFARESHDLQSRVLNLVLMTVLVTLAGVFALSYHLLRPVRRLVAATNRAAGGDLNQEIPISSHDELGDLTRSFNRMLTDLARIQQELVRSEKLIALGRLSAGVAHEIRNPLNAMKGAMVHLRQKRPDEPLIQEIAGLVTEEIDRLDRLVAEFLYFSKQAPPRLSPTDLNLVILGAQALLIHQASRKGVRFENRLDEGLPPVPLDAHQMEQALLNLAINAMDAVPPGGEVRFTSGVKEEGGARFAAIEVVDKGVGIGPEDLPNVFDPFFTTKEEGTGLGLPLSLGIVEAHGGSLEIESRPGEGTRATIRLPLDGSPAG